MSDVTARREGAARAYPLTVPAPRAPIVGRVDELDAVERALVGDTSRLVTLVGTGGVGKTRIAIEIAHGLDHVWPAVFVPLSGIDHADLVLPSVVAASGGSPGDDVPVVDVLVERFRADPALVVLDTMEHVLTAASDVAALIAACPGLRVLVTSRVELRVAGETVVPVRPLDTPSESGATDVGLNEAVALFVQCAHLADPSFTVTADSAATIAEICRRLDGLPLAIELAAARLRLLTPKQMLGLLDQRLGLLRSSMPTGESQHRTLHAAIEWSVRMLPVEDQRRFAALGVFAGGFDLDAAAAVTGGDQHEMLDTIERLVDHHLLHPGSGENDRRRFDLLDTVREFAVGELTATGREQEVRDAHAAWFLELAERGGAALSGASPSEGLELLFADHDNLRAATAWLSAGTDVDDDRLLRLVAPLRRFWWAAGLLDEGCTAMAAALANRPWPPSQAYGFALVSATDLNRLLGHNVDAGRYGERAIAVLREIDGDDLALALGLMGKVLTTVGDIDGAQAHFAEASALARAKGIERVAVPALHGEAIIAVGRGDFDRAAEQLEAAVALARSVGDELQLAGCLSALATVVRHQGRVDDAIRLATEAADRARSIESATTHGFSLVTLADFLVDVGDLGGAAAALDEARQVIGTMPSIDTSVLYGALGRLEFARGNLVGATEHCITGLEHARAIETLENRATLLDDLGTLAVALGKADRACHFFAVSDTCALAEGDTYNFNWRAAVVAARATITSDATGEATVAWSVDDEIAAAVELHQIAVDRVPRADPLRTFGLTAREAEVARLLVRRMSDRQIADELYIGVRTVATHVSAVLRKLEAANRREVPAAVDKLDAQ